MKNLLSIFNLNFGTERIYGLDVLRAAAILFVLYSHSIMLLPPYLGEYLNYFYIDGVCIFFVLSGYLIGTILIKTVEKNGFQLNQLMNFWIRRWARTLPNYFLFLVILAILNKAFVPGFPLRVVPQYIIFSQNLLENPPGFFYESWSLSIEEWFYITTPLLLFFLLKLSKLKVQHAVLIILSAIILFSIIGRYCLLDGDRSNAVVVRLDNIMYGVLGAYVSFYYRNFWLKYKKPLFIIGCCTVIAIKLLSLFSEFSHSWAFWQLYFYPIICIGILFTLPLLSGYNIKKHNRFTRFITTISLISYSLYLINYSLMRKLIIENIFKEFFEGYDLESTAFRFIFFWISSILCSILIYKYYEIPTMKIRDRIKFSR